MALVTMKELLERAKSNYRGIGAFSVGNMEMVKGAIQAAKFLAGKPAGYYNMSDVIDAQA